MLITGHYETGEPLPESSISAAAAQTSRRLADAAAARLRLFDFQLHSRPGPMTVPRSRRCWTGSRRGRGGQTARLQPLPHGFSTSSPAATRPAITATNGRKCWPPMPSPSSRKAGSSIGPPARIHAGGAGTRRLPRPHRYVHPVSRAQAEHRAPVEASGTGGLIPSMRRFGRIAACLLACASDPAASQTAPKSMPESVYVIDRLVAGVHRAPKPKSPLTHAFPTGTKLEVLERKGSMARVRGPAGETGWVEGDYLMTEMPARLVVAILEDEKREIQEENQLLKTQLANTAAGEQSGGIRVRRGARSVRCRTRQARRAGAQVGRGRERLRERAPSAKCRTHRAAIGPKRAVAGHARGARSHESRVQASFFSS